MYEKGTRKLMVLTNHLRVFRGVLLYLKQIKCESVMRGVFSVNRKFNFEFQAFLEKGERSNLLRYRHIYLSVVTIERRKKKKE